MNTPLAAKSPMSPPRLQSAAAAAYASVGNVGVGFDILGHSLAGACDRAEVRRIDTPTVLISSIQGCVEVLPTDAAQNTAGAALLALRKALGLQHGFELSLHKGIALGSGMGGSAASCVAALVAANALLERPLPRESLYGFALEGEAVASGGRHGDNVGPMLLGGLVLATRDRLVRVPVPPTWHCALVHPHVVLETRKARAALAGDYALGEFVAQSANLALVLAGCWRGEAELVREGLKDVLVEPRRAPLVPNFARKTGGTGSSCDGREHFRCGPQRIRLVRASRRSRGERRSHARRVCRSGSGKRYLRGSGGRPRRVSSAGR
jgi:homoserine kinase